MSENNILLKTRKELKRFFEDGQMPNGQNFANLIDAMVHRDDQPLAVAESQIKESSIKAAVLPVPSSLQLQAPSLGWTQTAGRMGTYDAAKRTSQINRAVNLTRDFVPADGKFHVILPDLTDCFGFEIVASASGRVNSSKHAITRAVVLISFGISGDGILQTCTYKGLDYRQKIRLKWVKKKDTYDLCMGTGVSFGDDEQGKKVQIQYHVTRIW